MIQEENGVRFHSHQMCFVAFPHPLQDAAVCRSAPNDGGKLPISYFQESEGHAGAGRCRCLETQRRRRRRSGRQNNTAQFLQSKQEAVVIIMALALLRIFQHELLRRSGSKKRGKKKHSPERERALFYSAAAAKHVSALQPSAAFICLSLRPPRGRGLFIYLFIIFTFFQITADLGVPKAARLLPNDPRTACERDETLHRSLKCCRCSARARSCRSPSSVSSHRRQGS